MRVAHTALESMLLRVCGCVLLAFFAFSNTPDALPPAAVYKADSWQAASASSLSPTFGGGTGNSLYGVEASLSVLVDGSAGFEPPAPPTVESDDGHRPHDLHNNDGADNNTNNRHHHGSNKQRGSSGMDGRREGRDEGRSTGGAGSSKDGLIGKRSDEGGRRQEGGCNDSRGEFNERGRFQTEGAAISPTGDNPTGDYRGSTHEHGVSSAAAVGTGHSMESKTAPKVPGNGSGDIRGGTGVLRGVSAAMASGALPVAARPNPNVSSAVDQDKLPISGGRAVFPDEELTSDRLPHVVSDETNRASSRGLDSAGLYETTSTSGGDGGGSGFAQESSGGGHDPGTGFSGQSLASNWRQDERGEQARRHVDQALRQRALRRRNRCASLSRWIR